MKHKGVVRICCVVTLAVVLALGGGCATTGEKSDEEIRDAEWHYKMGDGYFRNEKIHLAIQELTKALEMDPEMAKAHFLLGFIYSGRKKYPRAIRHYKKALELKENFFSAKNNLGSVYMAMERWRDAADLFKELLDKPMYPTPELAHNNLGWAQYQLREYSKALEHLKMAVFLKPEMCLAYNNLGLTHKEMGNRSKAVENFQKSIRKCPDNYAEPHFHLGKMLQEQGDPKARQHFRKCASLETDSNLGDRCREYLKVR